MKVVLDTNVVVSAFINPHGAPSDVMKIIMGGKATLFYNSAILSEYECVLQRSKFIKYIDPNHLRRLINILGIMGTSFDPIPGKIKLPDESDRIFYDTAMQSNSLLISGNLKHFPKEDFIISPVDFLKVFT